MELRAVLELLLSTADAPLLVQSDSQYVIKVFTEWLSVWKTRGMRTSGRKAVENQDLILEIDALLSQRDIEWEWVRGHVGHPMNERADSLARFAAERSKELRDNGSVRDRQNNPPRGSSGSL